LKEHSVIGDVTRDFEPRMELKVEWPDTGVAASFGNELKPTQTQKVPKISFEAAPDTLYTLVKTDPDAPSREKAVGEWHHWFVANIPGNDIAKGDTIYEYIGEGPPQETGLHRYVYLLYQQRNGKIDVEESLLSNRSQDNRAGHKTKTLASKYSLGNPVAVNFHQAKWDEYVPQLYKQLSEIKYVAGHPVHPIGIRDAV